jgi:Tfp pilus assembly protein PilF
MTKKELREDPVLESLQKGISWFQANTRWVLLGAVGIVAVIAVGLMLLQGRRASHERAALELAQARTLMFQGQMQQARTGLEGIVTRDRGTEAAVEAHLLLGDINLRLGQPNIAKNNFEEALRRAKDPIVKSGAQRGLAAAFEDLGSKAEASRHYEMAAGSGRTAAALNDLMNAGRTAYDSGDVSRAREIYSRCLDLAEEVAQGRVNEVKLALAEVEAAGGPPGLPSI